MIGRLSRAASALRARQALVTGLVATVALGAVLGQRSADPFLADPGAAAAARSALAAARAEASDALDALAVVLDDALREGRIGASLTVAGDQEPGPHLAAAADALADGDALVLRASDALGRVAGQLAVLQPQVVPPQLVVDPGAVGSAAAQLADTVDAANAFGAMRRATQATLQALGIALAALDRSDPAAALGALDTADQQLAAVKAWPGQLQTLPIWIDTTGRLLAAARAIAVAARNDDPGALKAAGDEYTAAAADAHQADLALSIAFAEGGGGVTQAPLQALADVRAAVEDAQAQLAGVSPGSG